MGRGVGLSENIKFDDNIKGDDEVIIKESTTYNKWCAAQGLVDLSSDQPKQGNICKLHDKSQDISKSVDKDKEVDTERNVKPNNGKQVDEGNNVKPDSGKRVDKEKNLNVESKEEETIVPARQKWQLYVSETMKARKAKNILTNIRKHKLIANKGKHSCKPEEIQKKEDTGVTLRSTEGPEVVKNIGEQSGVTISSLSESKMAEIRKEVEQMIKEGKSDAKSLSRIKTIKDILTMLDALGIHKLNKKGDEKQTECANKDNEIKDMEGSDIVTETCQNVLLQVKIEEIESSDEFTSDSGMKKDINMLIEKLVSDSGYSKKVSFTEKPTCIDTMTQLDETLDDTVSVENLVIDETLTNSPNKVPVTDTGQDDEVTSVVNDLVDSVMNSEQSDDISGTPPCSQMPRVDSYARRSCQVTDDSHENMR